MADFLHLDLPLWTPPLPNPAAKPDNWNTVAGLRSPAAIADRLTVISQRSAASQLEDRDSHPL
jgi:hypothetical protein